MICHVEEKSVRCRTAIINSFVPLDPNSIKALDASDAEEARALSRSGRRRNYASEVVSRMHGPLGREAFLVGVSHRSLVRAQGVPISNDIVSALHSLRSSRRTAS